MVRIEPSPHTNSLAVGGWFGGPATTDPTTAGDERGASLSGRLVRLGTG